MESIWLLWSISFIWFNQINEIDQSNQPTLTLQQPTTVHG